MAIPILVSVAAIAGSLFPLRPVRNAATLESVSHVQLVTGPWYAVLSPLYNIWDALALLPASEHIALLALALTVYVFWRSRAVRLSTRRVVWSEIIRATISLALLVTWYLIGAMARRPMASLEVDDPDIVVVDFHSHTEASHDGRPGFSAERNREWHRAAGFDVAYISDHGTYAAIQSALSRNPALAGDGTVLLPGFETRYSGQHLNVLGFAAKDVYGRSPPASLASLTGSPLPRAMLTIPGAMDDAFTGRQILAVELIDGSPRGLEFSEKRRSQLLELCATLGAAPVAGSNNHGWGRTAPGWTLLRIPGWRSLTPVALDRAILATLASAASDRGRVIVVERATPVAGGPSIHVATASALVLNPFRTLTIPEQVAWIAWVWLGWGTRTLLRRRRK
jgi:hypothetical protein